MRESVKKDMISTDDITGLLHKFERRDLIWLLAYPVYQTVGTIRHEMSHALAVVLEGGEIRKFVFWPTWDEKFHWGYVQWTGNVSWLVSAAPYLVDLLTFAVFFLLLTKVRFSRRWLWINLYLIGLVSPLVNSGYRYVSNFFREGDLTGVMAAVPPALVHAYFVVMIALYAAGLVLIQKRSKVI